ncbi:MAG: hypothetical protein GY877_08095 [Hyphomicrobium sp.]|nr:hypothetical protein [Hyphomicrobium sp.]
MTHMNGRIIRDLVLGRNTELTDLWFVNRRSLPFPPEPFRAIGAKSVMAAMALDDGGAIGAESSTREEAASCLTASSRNGVNVTYTIRQSSKPTGLTRLAGKPVRIALFDPE